MPSSAVVTSALRRGKTAAPASLAPASLPAANLLSQLPAELLVMIFYGLDMEDTYSLFCTCTRMYAVFKQAENRLLSSIFRWCVSPFVAPEALDVWWVTGGLRPMKSSTAKDRYRYLRNRRALPEVWLTVASVTFVTRQYRAIEQLADLFVETCRAEHPNLLAKETTCMEHLRIMRAFYRYELYNALLNADIRSTGQLQPTFLDGDGDGWVVMDHYDTTRKRFFKCFSEVEVTQLACIYDFLADKVLKVYREIAVYDIEYGSMHIDPSPTVDSPEVYYLLGLDITRICGIVRARTWDAKHKAIVDAQNQPAGRLPRCRDDSLKQRLLHLDCRALHGEMCFAENFYCSDSDFGPSKAVIRAQLYIARPFTFSFLMNVNRNHNNHKTLVYHEAQRRLRSSAFCMWNESRLESSRSRLHPDTVPVLTVRDSFTPWHTSIERHWLHREHLRSWIERLELWRQGIRGRWVPKGHPLRILGFDDRERLRNIWKYQPLPYGQRMN